MIADGPQMRNVGAPEDKNPSQSPHAIPITGRDGVFDSSFWKGAMSIIGARYLPLPFLRYSIDPAKQKDFYTRQIYSGISGALMEGATLFFAYRTRQDMLNIFSAPVALEFDKNPEDVTYGDLKRSKNTMVQQTVDNYVKYNLRRFGVNLIFFAPLVVGGLIKTFMHKGPSQSAWHPDNWHGETGANLGVGLNAAYLFSDVISRKQTPFELLQLTIDRKMNHAERFGDKMTADDLLDIYERHAAEGKIKSFLPQRGTPEWERSMALFERMADLMNQTYKNTLPQEQADFGMDDFIYIVGNGLIEPGKTDQTRAFIEVANHYDIPALKEVVKAMKNGRSLDEALQKYPVALPKGPAAEPAAAEKKYTSVVPSRAGERPPAAPGTLPEQVKAQRTVEQQLGQ